MEQRHLRVAFVAHGAGGGAHLLLKELVAQLRDDDLCETLVVAPSEGHLADDLRSTGAQVVTVRFDWWCSRGQDERPGLALRAKRVLHLVRSSWSSATRVRRVMERFDPDVVVTNTCVTATGALAAARMRRPHVWLAHEHGRDDYGFSFFLGHSLSLRLLGLGSAEVLAISRALECKLSAFVPHRKLRVLHAASTMPSGSAQGPRQVDDPIDLVLVGAGGRGKGIDDALRALSILRSRGVQARLRLVGMDETQLPAPHDGSADGRDAVSAVGRVDNVVAELDRAQVGLICSRWEAFGRVTVEYLRRGRPVLGTRSGGTPELVVHGETGYLYEPGNAAQLADLIETLAASTTLVSSMSAAALESSRRRFVLADYARDLCQILEDLVTSRQRPHRRATSSASLEEQESA